MAIFSVIEECPRKGPVTLFIKNIPVHIQKKFCKERRQEESWFEPKITSGNLNPVAVC